jgi:isopentenyl-diphosphate delta-isomerase
VTTVALTAVPRSDFGKGAARRIRREGNIPAVIYGQGTELLHIALPNHDLDLALRKPRVVITVQVDGKSILTKPRDIQRDPVKRSLEHVDLSTSLAGRSMRAPLMIAPMTGGTPEGLAFNRRLAAAAQRFGLAMGVGSQRVALERTELANHFRVRDLAPDIPLFANFGGGQLARGWGADEARRAVAMIGADAIYIHFNAVQEAIQGGDRDFRDIAIRLTSLCRTLEDDGIPVFAREVGFGMSGDAARRLRNCGVAGVDCAGAGGTSWSKVEAFCAVTPERRALGHTFGEWGTPTARCVVDIRRTLPDVTLIATGGLRSGIDLAKAIGLGADVEIGRAHV